MTVKFKRCKADDPHRCCGQGGNGQCPFLAHFDEITKQWSQYCIRHGARIEERTRNTADTNLYHLHKYNQRVLQLENHPKSKSLTAELAILRMLLENKIIFLT
jgi:hypothetical protein